MDKIIAYGHGLNSLGDLISQPVFSGKWVSTSLFTHAYGEFTEVFRIILFIFPLHQRQGPGGTFVCTHAATDASLFLEHGGFAGLVPGLR
jgi:hypothetical protein